MLEAEALEERCTIAVELVAEAEGGGEREKELQRKWSQVFISNTLATH